MRRLILISALLFSFNATTDEWSAYIYPSSNESRYIGRFETKEDCQAKAECYIEKTNVGSLLDIIFANKIEKGSFECVVTEHGIHKGCDVPRILIVVEHAATVHRCWDCGGAERYHGNLFVEGLD